MLPTVLSDEHVSESIETKKQDEVNPKNKFLNPLDFILMKEIVKRNPPKKKTFVKERSIESESEGMSMASVMKSLKRMVKAINPKHEFPSDVAEQEWIERRKLQYADQEKKELKEQILENSKPNSGEFFWEVRIKKNQGASLVPFNRHASR